MVGAITNNIISLKQIEPNFNIYRILPDKRSIGGHKKGILMIMTRGE